MKQTQTLMAAHAAMQAGRLDEARRDVLALLRSVPGSGEALHLLALVERRRGDAAAARAAFAGAAKLLPADPQLYNNLGNFLQSQGDTAAALASYARAIALKPDFADAHLNCGIVALATGDAALAEQSLQRATTCNPKLAKAWLVLAQALRAQEKLPAAADAFDCALALAPGNPAALAGRAWVALDRGEAAARERMQRARDANPQDRALELAAVAVAAEAGGHAELDRLAAKLDTDVGWLDGHRMLARLRWRMGDTDGYAASLRKAVQQAPDNPLVWLTYLDILIDARDYRLVGEVATQAEAHIGADPRIRLAQAAAASETGRLHLAHKLFADLYKRMPEDRDVALGFVRLLLRQEEPTRAIAVLDPLTRASDNLAWAYTGTAWRVLKDARADWLHGDPAIFAQMALPLDDGALHAALAALDRLHTTRRAPLGQTLVGGTQSSGRLFLHMDKAIQQIRAGCQAAVDAFTRQLGATADGHPLLSRIPASPRIGGSWSVRLQAGGRHINHVHPDGWLSSALHVQVPEGAGDIEKQGWLVLGKPPEELGLKLSPLAEIRPVPGSLVLFPAFVWHGTQPFSRGERVTIAFDV